MDKSLLVPKTVNWTSKPKEEDVLTSRDFLKLDKENISVLVWHGRLREYAYQLDQKVRDSFTKP